MKRELGRWTEGTETEGQSGKMKKFKLIVLFTQLLGISISILKRFLLFLRYSEINNHSNINRTIGIETDGEMNIH